MDDQCKYPGCTVIASTTWGRVPLCSLHNEAINEETTRFYNARGRGRTSGTEKEQRPHFYKIAHRIPWSKEQLAEKGYRK